ncbi:MAG TPA: bifunctional DNA-formamidopyrimidine glycosylase/DNA-(apurinic or apyrimidinic site) lyase, partial [Phycisphaerae bacterium]
IADFRSRWRRQVSPNAAAVRRAIVGRTITRLSRRGKFIVLQLDTGDGLLVHLRMSGRFEWTNGRSSTATHVRAVWNFEDGHRLLLCDARKFGRIIHTHDLAGSTRALGPEPLGRAFTVDALAKLLEARSRRIKPLLLDQTVIAGLGNIYTDEALFRAGVHPLTHANGLRRAAVARLHGAIREVLREGIRRNGTSIDWIYPEGRMQEYLRVYGRAGAPCVTCGTPIIALRVAQRGTHICPSCQPASFA